MATFTGAISLPDPMTRHLVETSGSVPVATSGGVQIEQQGSVMGDFSCNMYFDGALLLEECEIDGIIILPSVTFTGVLVTQPATMVARRTGRVFKEVIFMNETPTSFDDSDLNTLIDQYYPLVGSGAISGSGTFTTSNNLTGEALVPPGSPHRRTIRTRRFELGNKRALSIAPLIQRAMNAKVRTYIKTPALFRMTMTWKIPSCSDGFVNNLIGLLYFKQIRMVLGDDEYLCVLLDDVISVLNESRTKKSITLNFEGRPLI